MPSYVKHFHIKVLMNEMGVIDKDNISGNTVYQQVHLHRDVFFKNQEQENIILGNCLEEENKHIPLLYWTSKQHKNPYKFRFIARASHSTNKTVSKEI